MRKHYLKYPSNYDDKLAEVYNTGCGPGTGWKNFLIPDTIYGISIREACKIHDYMYEVGRSGFDKLNADNMFFSNLYLVINYESKWWNRWLNPLRRKRAWIYYMAVHHSGQEAFDNKVEGN